MSAAAIPRDMLADPVAFDAFESQQPALLQFFDQVVVLDTAGQVTAGSFRGPSTPFGVDLHDRGYFQRAMAFAKPVISDPLRGKVTGTPIVDFAAPIVDADGKVVAVMVGVCRSPSATCSAFATAKLGQQRLLHDRRELSRPGLPVASGPGPASCSRCRAREPRDGNTCSARRCRA